MKRRRVPEILWRLFGNRARTLGDTILSLIPLKTSANCQCKGRRCLGCVGENAAMSFLLRENDPDDYRKLLNQCFIVVSDQAPPLRSYDPHCRWPHLELVRRTIEMTISEQCSSSNVISFDYDKMRRFSDIVEVLTSPSWSLLLKRIGDALMVYLLKNTSIFLRLPRNKHHQVAGVPISDFCLKSHLHICATNYKPSLLHPGKNVRWRSYLQKLQYLLKLIPLVLKCFHLEKDSVTRTDILHHVESVKDNINGSVKGSIAS